MMPFALNEATEFISPTKTLEYLAGGKPVISTPIRDVVSLYGKFVTIAATLDQFMTRIDALLTAAVNPTEIEDVQDLVRRYDWNVIANSMKSLVTSVRSVEREAPTVNARFLPRAEVDRSRIESVQTVGVAD